MEKETKSKPTSTATGAPAQRRAGGERGKVRLSGRDARVLGVLAVARHLSTDQIRRLFGWGRWDGGCRRRLAELAGLFRPVADQHPFLERIRLRLRNGSMAMVWTPTALGYLEADQRLRGLEVRAPEERLSLEFLEHELALNELLVALLLGLPDPTRIDGAPFVWTPSESTRLPWREQDLKAKAKGEQARLIVPDARLEVPIARRRYFLECEMGTQPIVAAAEGRAGATVHKAERYARFFTRHSLEPGAKGQTHYGWTFPDGWEKEVWFLVHSPLRQRNVNAALETWRKRRGECGGRFRAVLRAQAAAELGALWAKAPRKKEPRVLGEQELLRLQRFYAAAIDALRRARAQAREKGLWIPGYPEGAEEVRDWLEGV
jgi:hypothetical protein